MLGQTFADSFYACTGPGSLQIQIEQYNAASDFFEQILVAKELFEISNPSQVHGLDVCRAMVLGTNGDIFVTSDHGSSQQSVVLRYSINGTFISTFSTIAVGRELRSMIFSGNYMFLSYQTGVMRFNATTGAFVDDFIVAGQGASGPLVRTWGIAIGPNGNLYLADQIDCTKQANFIREYDINKGAYLGNLLNQLVCPFVIAFSGINNTEIVFTGLNNSQSILQRYDIASNSALSEGTSLGDIGSDITKNYPEAFAIDPTDNSMYFTVSSSDINYIRTYANSDMTIIDSFHVQSTPVWSMMFGCFDGCNECHTDPTTILPVCVDDFQDPNLGTDLSTIVTNIEVAMMRAQLKADQRFMQVITQYQALYLSDLIMKRPFLNHANFTIGGVVTTISPTLKMVTTTAEVLEYPPERRVSLNFTIDASDIRWRRVGTPTSGQIQQYVLDVDVSPY